MKRSDAVQIDKSKAWCFFNGVAQKNPNIGGISELLHISDSHWFKLAAGIGTTNNSRVKLLAVLKVFKLVVLSRVDSLKVFGDSLLVID